MYSWMTILWYDCWKREGLSRRRKLENVGAETTSSSSLFQIRGPETLNARLPTVGTSAPPGDWSWQSGVPADRADLLLGRVVRGTVALCRVPCMSVRRPCIGCALALVANVDWLEHQWCGQSALLERSAVLQHSSPITNDAENRLGCSTLLPKSSRDSIWYDTIRYDTIR